MGALTVELVAIHAAMAGCKPDYMPVLLAALEALLDPKANWRGLTTTTATSAVLVIANGPIIYEIGLASRQGAAGTEHHANASIGYAINLIADIVGVQNRRRQTSQLLEDLGTLYVGSLGKTS
jgi:hypothetical protein